MTLLQDLTGTNCPVFPAGMGGIAGPDLAAALSNAGALGHLGGIRMAAEDIRTWIRQTRAKTDNPFGINMAPPGGGPNGFEAQLSVVLEEKPKVVSLFWDDFSEIIPRLKAAGITTMVQVGSAWEAKKAAADGADIIIAQGVEAGGHVRGTVGLFTLLPAVLEVAGNIPVLAGGGISTAEKVKAALDMGASGAWVGTSFVASDESLAHDIYKQRLVEAGTDDAVYERFYSFGWPIGTPYRVIRPKVKGLLQYKAAGARKIDTEKTAHGVKLYAGQGVGDVKAVRPAKDILTDLCAKTGGLPETGKIRGNQAASA